MSDSTALARLRLLAIEKMRDPVAKITTDSRSVRRRKNRPLKKPEAAMAAAAFSTKYLRRCQMPKGHEAMRRPKLFKCLTVHKRHGKYLKQVIEEVDDSVNSDGSAEVGLRGRICAARWRTSVPLI